MISPYLRFSDRIKEMLEDKNRLKLDIRIVYRSNELQEEDADWLAQQTFIRSSLCKDLHAKCYLSETGCIITSMNLYEFSQVNNNEMGILLMRDEDSVLYQEAYEEASRIVRISATTSKEANSVSTSTLERLKFNLHKLASPPAAAIAEITKRGRKCNGKIDEKTVKLTTSKLAKKLGLTTNDLL